MDPSGVREGVRRLSNYGPANKQVQWFAGKYPGSKLNLKATTMVVCLHTTEGTGWPSYDGGGSAPTYTGQPPLPGKAGSWRAHFPDEMSARALRNLPGGVATNTLNVVQIELIGTCDPKHKTAWGTRKAGRDYVFWPQATEAQMKWLAEILADLHKRHGLRLQSPLTFKPYPASYGNNGVRMNATAWRNFTGVCGHMHVPENDHGDPGNINIARILTLARGGTTVPNRVSRANNLVDQAIALYSQATSGNKRPVVAKQLVKIKAARKAMPAK